jgi:hypothetical protein
MEKNREHYRTNGGEEKVGAPWRAGRRMGVKIRMKEEVGEVAKEVEK